MFIPVIFLFLAIFAFGVGPVSADPGVIYVNNQTGNDFYDGQSPVYNSSTGSGPKLSIKNATGTVTNKGTVNIADGLYAGENNTNIQISQDVTIIGGSQSGTILDAGNIAQIFIVPSGVTLTLENLTLTNGTADQGGAIYSSGTLIINNTKFTGNNATRGGAIYNSGGTLNVTNDTFTNNVVSYNGGAIYNTGTLTVNNSTFTSNTAQTEGWGGGIYNNGGTTTVTGSTFTNNQAEHGGGIHNKVGTLTVTNSTFINNTATIGGSAVCNGGNSSTSTVNFCRIIGNNVTSVYNKKTGPLNAENNWWGSNFDGTDPQSAGMTNITVNTWIVLKVTASPDQINHYETSTITADLTHNNKGDNTSSQGHIPDNTPVIFNSNLGTIPNGTTLNGQAIVLFMAKTTGGLVTINATVDNVLQSTSVNLGYNTAPVLDSINDKGIDENQSLNFSISGQDADGDSLTYSATNLPTGATFDSNTGAFSWTPTYSQAGSYQVTFTASDGSLTDTKTVKITVNNVDRAPTLGCVSDKTIDENKKLSFSICGDDLDKDNLTYSATNLPAGATFNTKTGAFSWNPSYSQAGNYKITFTVSDGSLTDSKTMRITVNNIDNVIPKVTKIDPVEYAVINNTRKVVTVTFSEAVKYGSGWIELQKTNGTKVAIKTATNGKTLYIAVNSALANGTYRVLLHSGCVTDLTGNSLGANVSSFTVDTVAPKVKVIYPKNASVTRNTSKIMVVCNETMKMGTGWIELQKTNGTKIAVKTAVSDSTLYIAPVKALSNGTYRVILHGGCLTDQAGNRLTGYLSYFTIKK